MITVTNPDALSWKHPGLQGIRTRGGVLIGWPGTMPTQIEVDAWEAEYIARDQDPEIDARMDAWMDIPEMKSLIEALADLPPGPNSAADVRNAAKAKHRVNAPRN